MLSDLLESIKTSSQPRIDRPTVTLSYAQSLDGSIAMYRGVPFSLSGKESQIITHKLRATHDAILVGINTVISDNPHLTVRLTEGRNPLPIVLDSRLRLPLNSNLLRNDIPPLIATTNAADPKKQKKIEKFKAKIIRMRSDKMGWVDLNFLLRALANLGIESVMVEGGARVITSFLSQHLVDRIIITIAPVFLGGLHAVENPLIPINEANPSLRGLPELKNFTYEQIGQDMVFWSALSWASR